MTHEQENRSSDARRTIRIRHSRRNILIATGKADIVLQGVPGLVHRPAATGVGVLRDRVDCRSSHPHTLELFITRTTRSSRCDPAPILTGMFNVSPLLSLPRLFHGCGDGTLRSGTSIPDPRKEPAATLAKVTAARDAFVARIHASGFSCPTPVPTILIEDVPSFGRYDEKDKCHSHLRLDLAESSEAGFLLPACGSGSQGGGSSRRV